MLNLQKGEFHRLTWLSRPTARPRVDPRSPLRVGANKHALPKLAPSRSFGLGAWRRNGSRFPTFGLKDSGCGACVVAVVFLSAPLLPLLPRSRCSSDLAAPSSSLFPRRCRCSLVVAAPVAAASSLRVPWTFGILGSLRMPYCRGRHLIRVRRPIGSPSRHTPGRMRFSVPGGRIRAQRVCTDSAGHTPGRVRHSPPNRREARGFGVASPLTPGDTLCIRPNAWIRILLTFPGCPWLVSLLGLSSRAGYPLLCWITPGLMVRN